MVRQRTGIEIEDGNGVSIYLPERALSASDRQEFAANARFEDSLASRTKEMVIFDDILFKANFIKTFRKAESHIHLSGDEKILELGVSILGTRQFNISP